MTSAAFPSLLFVGARVPLSPTQPYFTDLNLTPILDAVAAAGPLAPYFATPVNRESIELRHNIFRELDANRAVREVVEGFLVEMTETRRLLAVSAKVRNPIEAMGWHLEAGARYVGAVGHLVTGLIAAQPRSAPLAELTAHLSVHVSERGHAGLKASVGDLRRMLSALRYCVLIDGDHVSVRAYADEPDFSTTTRAVLERLLGDDVDGDLGPADGGRTGGGRSAGEVDRRADLNAVESQILAGVGRLFGDEFDALARFVESTREIIDPRIGMLATELSFYTCYRQFMARTASGARAITFCLPDIAADASSATWIEAGYDLALVLAPRESAEPLVDNDFRLDPGEWAALVSGPNQAGKTTYARMVGQLHHLGAVGVPIPARRATLRPISTIFTHFERAQNAASDRGRLADELARVAAITDAADRRSMVILNDTFASTSLTDARTLGTAILDRLHANCAVCVYVSALDELADGGAGIVGMASIVDPTDVATPTFRVERTSAHFATHAAAMAAKYRLTYGDLTARLRR